MELMALYQLWPTDEGGLARLGLRGAVPEKREISLASLRLLIGVLD